MKAKYLFMFLVSALVLTSCSKEEWDLKAVESEAKIDNFAEKSYDDENCSVNLIAGRNTNVGEVITFVEEDFFKVSYVITNPEWEIVDIHLALSTDSPGTGEWLSNRWQNRSGNPAPGRFPFHFEDGSFEDGVWSISIPLSEIGPDGVKTGDFVCMGAHAVVRKTSGSGAGGTETAWGEGHRFVNRGNWAMYFCCEINDNPEPSDWIIFGATSSGEGGVRALYEINMNTQVETKIFEVPQTIGRFAPNGLAFDEDNNRLYYAVDNELWFFDRTLNANVFAGLVVKEVFGAVFADGKYWYVRNSSSDLYAISFKADGTIESGANTPFEVNFAGRPLDFGDIAYDASTNVIYGSTVNTGPTFFKYDLNEPAGSRYTELGSERSGLQLALVGNGSLYGHITPNRRFYLVDKDDDVAPVLLFTGQFSYNDLAPGPSN